MSSLPSPDATPAHASLPPALQELWTRIGALDTQIRKALGDADDAATASLARERDSHIVALGSALAEPDIDPGLRQQLLSSLQTDNQRLQQHVRDMLAVAVQDMLDARTRRRGIDAYHAQQESG